VIIQPVISRLLSGSCHGHRRRPVQNHSKFAPNGGRDELQDLHAQTSQTELNNASEDDYPLRILCSEKGI
jgi:hypothetical protein